MAAEAATVNPNGISTLLGKSVNIFLINCNISFVNAPRKLPRKIMDYITFNSSVFVNFIYFDELFTKVLRKLATCL